MATFTTDKYGVPNLAGVSGSAELLAHTYVGGLGVRNETAGSGLLLMGQRFYDPMLARWLSEDPIGFAGGLNQYAYVGHSPVNRVDASGLAPGDGGPYDIYQTGDGTYTNAPKASRDWAFNARRREPPPLCPVCHNRVRPVSPDQLV